MCAFAFRRFVSLIVGCLACGRAPCVVVASLLNRTATGAAGLREVVRQQVAVEQKPGRPRLGRHQRRRAKGLPNLVGCGQVAIVVIVAAADIAVLVGVVVVAVVVAGSALPLLLRC